MFCRRWWRILQRSRSVTTALILVVCVYLFIVYVQRNIIADKVVNTNDIKGNGEHEDIKDGGEHEGIEDGRQHERDPAETVNYNVHVFYYAWYGTPDTDGQWWHWNHKYIPPWDKHDHHKYPQGAHQPPQDIGSNFYPKLGPYSSLDPAVLSTHMGMISGAGIGVVSVSWYPPGMSDENGPPSDRAIPLILDAAAKYGVKVCLHIEPYNNRSVENIRTNLAYVHTAYSNHPAYYKRKVGQKLLPVFYIYDSYLIHPLQWQRLLSSHGDLSIRGTDLDGVFLGLLVEFKHRDDIKTAGFDGFYTYFASSRFSYGANWEHWADLAGFAKKFSLLFVPSVGPGYMDTRIRAWNSRNTAEREGGGDYQRGWRTAVTAGCEVVSITSFNEWGEGTMIEPAISYNYSGYNYQYYHKDNHQLYLQLTKSWVEQFSIQ